MWSDTYTQTYTYTYPYIYIVTYTYVDSKVLPCLNPISNLDAVRVLFEKTPDFEGIFEKFSTIAIGDCDEEKGGGEGSFLYVISKTSSFFFSSES